MHLLFLCSVKIIKKPENTYLCSYCQDFPNPPNAMLLLNSPYTHIHLPQTTSTNSRVAEMYTRGEITTQTVLTTDFQTAGRGLEANAWHSHRQQNLLFSLLVETENTEASRQFAITQTVSLGICEVLEKALPKQPIRVKWPNDIYVGDKKICGMLISNTVCGAMITHSIIGIGLNVNQEKFPASLPNPVSIRQITAKVYSRETLLGDLLENLHARFACLGSQNSLEMLRQAYLKALYRYGTWHTYKAGNKQFTARILDVNPFGHLVLEKPCGTKLTYALKEVVFN